MIRDLFLRSLKRSTVTRMLVAHPASVQYIDHYPEDGNFCIRYTSGQQVCIHDPDKEKIKKMVDDLVDQLKQT